MKQENGKGMIKSLLLLVIMIAIIILICMSINKNIKTQKEDSVVSNMMLIKGSCKVFNENRIRNNKEENTLIGTKLSNIGDDTEAELKSIIEKFKNTQTITEEEYEKYYVLTDKNLEELNVDVKNEKNSYFLINYESNEVIITKGYEGKYKLSEIEKARTNTENKEENVEDNNEEETNNSDSEENKEE